MTELHQLLAELIRIPSPNPPGDTRGIAAYISEWLRGTGADVRVLQPPDKPEAQSVVASLGSDESPVIMLHAHIDTVPVGKDEAKRWSSDPYVPTIVNGRMYGKGSIDDKAALAAMMVAFKKLAANGSPQGTLMLVAAAEEETGGQLGTKWLADAGHLLPPDFVVVGEQTHNQVALAHKGVMRTTITTKGHSVHATNPDRGINAITAMARIVLELNAYHRELASRKHPLIGVPTCNVGTIAGGSTANAVPDSCTITVDRRMVPREDPETVKQELQDLVASADVSPAVATIGGFLFSSWFDSCLATELGQTFLATVRQSTHADSEPVGYLPGSDAKHLMSLAQGDMIVFGPGSYEVAHSFDEFVELAALDQCEAILTRFLSTTIADEA